MKQNNSIKNLEIQSKWTINEVFQESKKILKDNYGLDLTIIEQARLRELIPSVLEEHIKIGESGLGVINNHGTHPPSELTDIFLFHYYGVTNGEYFFRFGEAFRKYLRKKQQEYHHEI